MKRQALESRLLVLVTLGLVAFGLVMVYSATSAPAALARTDPMSCAPPCCGCPPTG